MHLSSLPAAVLQALAQVARSTAAYLEIAPELGEQQLYDLLRANLAQNPLAYGSAIAFEPHQYKQGLALFSPYVYRDGETTKAIDIATEAYVPIVTPVFRWSYDRDVC